MKKSEREVIEWYCDHLLKNGFDSADIIKAQADIRAVKNGEIWWFGIIHTTEKDKYCGGFSETIWEQANNDPEHFRFVVIKDNVSTKYEIFKELTPEEYMNNRTKEFVIINGTLVNCPIGFVGNYVVPEEVTKIAQSAFKDCTGLQSITFHNNVQSIGAKAFEGCIGIEEINIPIGVNSIEEGTFMGCTNLGFIAIPPSVNRIDKNAFRGCSKLDMGIYDYSFDYNLGKEGLYNNIIPSSVEVIGDSAFRDCSSLEYITIPFGVTTIGKNAFSDCRKLTEIQISGSVTKIGVNVFSGCKKLKKILAFSVGDIYPLLSPPYQALVAPMPLSDQIDIIHDELQDRYSPDGVSLIRCPKHTIKYTIPEGVERIGNNAFAGCKILDSIVIPNTIKEIGIGAFSGCEQIRRVLLPESIVSIGQNAFFGCKALNEIYIPNGSRDKFEKMLPKHLHDKLKELN